MENGNPDVVLDAVTEAPQKFGEVEIGEVTILKYAYLEKLESPFLRPDVTFSVENVVPSVYVLAQGRKKLREYGNDVERLRGDALEWADEKLRLADVPEIVKAVVDRLAAIDKASPKETAVPESDPKKA